MEEGKRNISSKKKVVWTFKELQNLADSFNTLLQALYEVFTQSQSSELLLLNLWLALYLQQRCILLSRLRTDEWFLWHLKKSVFSLPSWLLNFLPFAVNSHWSLTNLDPFLLPFYLLVTKMSSFASSLQRVELIDKNELSASILRQKNMSILPGLFYSS